MSIILDKDKYYQKTGKEIHGSLLLRRAYVISEHVCGTSRNKKLHQNHTNVKLLYTLPMLSKGKTRGETSIPTQIHGGHIFLTQTSVPTSIFGP